MVKTPCNMAVEQYSLIGASTLRKKDESLKAMSF